jgi:Fe-S cluster assembly protein SufB
VYYANPLAKGRKEGTLASQSRDQVPATIRTIFDRLHIPEAEKKYLAGVGGQYDSSVVYHKLKEKRKKS